MLAGDIEINFCGFASERSTELTAQFQLYITLLFPLVAREPSRIIEIMMLGTMKMTLTPLGKGLILIKLLFLLWLCSCSSVNNVFINPFG